MPSSSLSQQRLLRPEEIITLSREIQAMISAGVPLDIGMRNVAAGFSVDLESAAYRLADRIEQGASISEAFRDETALPPVFRAILVAGLSCGQSEAVLRDVTNLTQMLISLRQSLKLGMVYPLIVVFFALGMFAVVVATMLPRVAGVYRQLYVEMPEWLSLATSFEVGPYHLLGLIVTFFAALFWLWGSGKRSPVSGLSWIPGVSSVARDFSIAQFSYLLSLLVTYGVPLPEALRLTGETIDSEKVRCQAFGLADAIEGGMDMESAMQKQSVFPQFLTWLLVTGYRDSDLGNALEQASSFYQGRARNRAIWISQVVPTATVLLVGGSVTLLYALTVFYPMVDLWSKLAQY